jgi:uncharacterized membrane protein
MKKNEILWPVGLIAGAVLTTVLSAGEVQGPGRVAVTLLFFGLFPGMAVLRLIMRTEFIPQMVLAAAISIALTSLIAMVMIYSGNWYPEIGMAILIVLTLVLAVLDLKTHNQPLRQPTLTIRPAQNQKVKRKHQGVKL